MDSRHLQVSDLLAAFDQFKPVLSRVGMTARAESGRCRRQSLDRRECPRIVFPYWRLPPYCRYSGPPRLYSASDSRSSLRDLLRVHG